MWGWCWGQALFLLLLLLLLVVVVVVATRVSRGCLLVLKSPVVKCRGLMVAIFLL
jgi:hypothetical protein